MVNEDIEIRDEVEQSDREGLSINEIILRHIRKISDLSCREFTGGFWEKKPVRTANGVMFSEVWHEDVREAYCNAVDFLIDVLYPKSDKDLQDYLKKHEKFEEKIEGEFKEIDFEEETESEKNKKIKNKVLLKRQTFRQINLMFERKNFWKGTGVSNE
jgi:hypothetical protein